MEKIGKKTSGGCDIDFTILLSMLKVKELAFFADVKPKVVKTYITMITAPKNMVIFTQVCAYLLCLKTFEFVSFNMQKLKFSS